MGILISGCSPAIAQEPIVQDHTKTVIKRVPFNYEVCSEVDVPADKTKDTILGAIIGGILGNQNSNNIGGKQMRCTKHTRYEDSMETTYSHSTVTFWYEGKRYNLKFKK